MTSKLRARSDSDHMLIDLVVGDDALNLVEPGDRRQRPPEELAGVGHGGDLARHFDHQGVELRFQDVVRTQPHLRIETIDAEKQPIGVQPAQHLLRLRTDGRRGHLPQDAADHDHADVRQRRQLHRDVERVGDHRERSQLEELQLPRDLRRRRARIEHDRFVVADQAGRGLTDAHLLAVMQRLLDRDRHVLLIEPLERAAVRAHHAAPVGERVEVAADGHGGDAEPRDELLDRRAFLSVQQLEDAPAALLHEQPDAPGLRVPRHPQTLPQPFADRSQNLTRTPSRTIRDGANCSSLPTLACVSELARTLVTPLSGTSLIR